MKSRLLFGCVFLGAGALALLYDDPGVGFTILYAMLLLLVLALATILAAPRLIEIEERVEQETVFKNEEVRYFMKVKNKGIFFYPRVRCALFHADIVGYEGEEPAAVEAIEPLRAAARIYKLRYPYRGVYELGIEKLVVTDFLGLFRYTMKASDPLTVTVYPEKDEGYRFSIRNEPQNSSLNQDLFNEDYSSVADVRKYTSSDSLRRIHWQLSAGRGELVVKNFNAFEPDKTILCLDTRRLPLEGLKKAAFEDKMVGYAASALDICMRGRLPAELLWGDADYDWAAIDAGDDDIGGVYELLAGIRFDREDSPLSAAGQIAGSYNMVVLTAGMDEPTHDAVRSLISFDHNIVLYSFHSPELPLDDEKEYLLESLRAWGAAVNSVPVGEVGEP